MISHITEQFYLSTILLIFWSKDVSSWSIMPCGFYSSYTFSFVIYLLEDLFRFVSIFGYSLLFSLSFSVFFNFYVPLSTLLSRLLSLLITELLIFSKVFVIAFVMELVFIYNFFYTFSWTYSLDFSFYDPYYIWDSSKNISLFFSVYYS